MFKELLDPLNIIIYIAAFCDLQRVNATSYSK